MFGICYKFVFATTVRTTTYDSWAADPADDWNLIHCILQTLAILWLCYNDANLL